MELIIFGMKLYLEKCFHLHLLGYVNPNNLHHQSATYVPGMIAIYEKDIKYPSDGNGPLRLVYASSSFTEEQIWSNAWCFCL